MTSGSDKTKDIDLPGIFAQRWETDETPPDVDRFLDPYDRAMPEHVAAVIQIDLNRRAALGQIVDPERYSAWSRLSDRVDLQQMLSSGELNDDVTISRETSEDPSFAETMVNGRVVKTEMSSKPDRERIGRYRVDSVLGYGGYGTVYLAYDEDLKRPVAIKAPRPDRLTELSDAEEFLREAQILAALDHPRILPVHDVGRTDDGLCYIVWKFIDGEDLRQRIRRRPLTHTETVELIARTAEALGYAHEHGLVHRDIKPGNILINEDNQPILIDFGLAIREHDHNDDGRMLVGTPAYMSPEQARGEGHLVDARSDIFSLGIILFELLTGRKPFTGSTPMEVLNQIMQVEIRGLRQFNDAIPRQLENICLKATSKRLRDRYATAGEFANDLHELQKAMTLSDVAPQMPDTDSPSSVTINRPVRVIPRGLQSFTADDSEFFPDLLPGNRSQDGLPECIQFWKTRIEDTASDNAFRIGLIYGPSGCGKSSLVKAGLFPNLSPDIVRLHVEAASDGTEARLLNQLKQRCPEIRVKAGLIAALGSIRRQDVIVAGRKVLIVIDQFEQWLSQRSDFGATELVRALRQCDGEHVQCILMVRDEFWLSVSRLMQEMDVDLTPGHNTALVDLFDQTHARRILHSFGVAYECLPEDPDQLTAPQHEFLDQAIEALSREDRVVSVQLAIFAEMAKEREWVPATLRSLGGVEGIGVTFLDQTFVSTRAPREYRHHQKGARRVLGALLPENETVIKGHLRSYSDLQHQAGYENREKEFAQLIRLLESDLRVITPADPLGDDVPSEDESVTNERHFQLTHDFLVPAIRNWLTSGRNETFVGRTQLRLEEQARIWAAKPETRRLPNLFDWLRSVLVLRRTPRSETQRQMLASASRFHLRNLVLLTALCVIVATAAGRAWRLNRTQQFTRQLQTASTSNVISVIEQNQDVIPAAQKQLRDLIRKSASASDQHLNGLLALLKIDPDLAEQLVERMLSADPVKARIILNALAPHRDRILEVLWLNLENESLTRLSRSRAAEALLVLFPSELLEERSAKNSETFAKLLVAAIDATQFPEEQIRLLDVFRPVQSQTLSSLISLFHDEEPETADAAAIVLRDYARDSPEQIAELFLTASLRQSQLLTPVLDRLGDAGANILRQYLAEKFPINPPAEARERAKRCVNAAITLLRLGQSDIPEVWAAFAVPTDPRFRHALIEQCALRKLSPSLLLQQIQIETDPAILCGLLTTIGSYPREAFTADEYPDARNLLVAMMGRANLPAVHSHAEWALRQWQETDALQLGLVKLANNAQKQDSLFTYGFNDTVLVHVDATQQPDVRRRFAICNKEVAREQYQRMDHTKYANPKHVASKRCSATVIRFHQALTYCHWLNINENIPKEEWCFQPIAEEDFEKFIAGEIPYEPDVSKTGYRLPLLAEWRYLLRRANSADAWFGGNHNSAIKYVWKRENSENQVHPPALLRPGVDGLFDLAGNVNEWCGDPQKSGGFAVLGGDFDMELLGADEVLKVSRLSPDVRYDSIGFRVARTLSVAESAAAE